MGRGRAEVRITGGNEAGHFTLDTVGDFHVVRVASQLDRETNSRYQLTLLAEDRGTPSRNSSVNVGINIFAPSTTTTTTTTTPPTTPSTIVNSSSHPSGSSSAGCRRKCIRNYVWSKYLAKCVNPFGRRRRSV